MIKVVPAHRGGSAYVAEYLEKMGDLWSSVLAPAVRRGGRVMVAGPAGAELGDLEAQSCGFGISNGLPEFLADQVRRYLAGGRNRFAVLELRETKGPFAFPVFRFRPSTLATWDGVAWAEWPEGFCGLVSAADGEAVLLEALGEGAWGHGVLALLSLAESDVARLRGDYPVGLVELERLAAQMEMMSVSAHDGEALAVWHRDVPD